MAYNVARGGHAPGHWRETFEQLVDEVVSERGQETFRQFDGSEAVGEEIFVNGPKPLRCLIEEPWNCTDTMPGWLCDALLVKSGSSFAIGVRSIADEIRAMA